MPSKDLKASDRNAEGPRLAVLGWGSLLRRPGELSIRGDWHSDGPWLPIEFARISKGGHLTLVIVPRRKSVQTYWALSGYATLKDATDNLARREGTGVADIGYLTLDDDQSARFKSYIARLRAWLKKRSLHGVIWTDLPSNFEDKTGREFSNSGALAYLRSADTGVRAKAADYIRIAPAQTKTQLRQRLEKELGISSSSKTHTPSHTV